MKSRLRRYAVSFCVTAIVLPLMIAAAIVLALPFGILCLACPALEEDMLMWEQRRREGYLLRCRERIPT